MYHRGEDDGDFFEAWLTIKNTELVDYYNSRQSQMCKKVWVDYIIFFVPNSDEYIRFKDIGTFKKFIKQENRQGDVEVYSKDDMILRIVCDQSSLCYIVYYSNTSTLSYFTSLFEHWYNKLQEIAIKP